MTDPEFELIDALYRKILRRGVDASGYRTYSALLRTGQATLQDIARILGQSDEFRQLATREHSPYHFEYVPLARVGSGRSRAAAPPGRNPDGPLVVATIVAKNTLSLARVTARSCGQYHPSVPFFALLVDEVDDWFQPAQEPFRLIQLSELGIPAQEDFLSRYTQQEACYAATPFLLEYLLDQGFSSVLFLKQESLVVGSLDPVFDRLLCCSLLVTPHLLKPHMEISALQGELNVLRAGIFNGGVVGVSDMPEARDFLHWWQERTYRNCYCLVEDGLHYEQRWLDFSPSLVVDLCILRDAGVNIGHWNLHDRDIDESNGKFTAAGLPCRIFRFSGYDPLRPEQVTRYDDSLEVKDTGKAAAIFARYQHLLKLEGYAETRHWPYAFAQPQSGAPCAAN